MAEGRPRQVVPRPHGTRRVEPPVDGLEVADPAVQLSIGAVRDAFAGAADPAAGTLGVPDAPHQDGGAAVLIAIGPDPAAGDAREGARPGREGPSGDRPRVDGATAASIVLIRRAAHLRRNPGEIGFPGGRIEPGEEALAAALREAEEEVALRAGAVEILGRLSTLGRSRAKVSIVAFVGVTPRLAFLEANPEEIDQVLVVPLAELVAPGRYWQERWDRAEEPYRTMHFFDLGEDVIWGATAHLLHALLLRVLSRREPSTPL